LTIEQGMRFILTNKDVVVLQIAEAFQEWLQGMH
jgi:hypothetical protein